MDNNLLLILLTLILSGFFSGMEIAFVSANRLSLEVDKKKGNLTSGILDIFTNNSSQYIATMLVGNNIALVIYGLAFARILNPFFTQFIQSDVLLLLAQTVCSTLLILVTAEFFPKTIFRINPTSSLKFFSIPLLFFYILLYPIASVSMKLSRWLINLVSSNKITDEAEQTIFTKVDLNHFVNQNEEDTKQEEPELKLFRNALDFSTVKLRDCLIPRTEIVAVEEGSSIEELEDLFSESNCSKIIVYRESIDHIIGYVHSTQLFENPQSLKTITNNIIIVPESMPAQKLLGKFTQRQKSIAVVVDEFGGTAGIVTTEDILEEIFGEIEDEHDIDDLIMKKTGDNEWLLSGRLEIDILNEKLNLGLQDNDSYETLAGLLLNHYGNIPQVNSTIEFDNFEAKIMKATNKKIELIKLSRLS